MTNLEEARDLRIEALKEHSLYGKTKEVLDAVVKALNMRTYLNIFYPVRVIIQRDFDFNQKTDLTPDNLIITLSKVVYRINDDNVLGVNIDATSYLDIQWYAYIIHEFLSKQDGLYVSKLYQTNKKDHWECISSFYVNIIDN